MTKSALDIFLDAFCECITKGDDEINARCRIIEMGATIEEADAVEYMFNQQDDQE